MWSVADIFDVDTFFAVESTIESVNWCGDQRRFPHHSDFQTYR